MFVVYKRVDKLTHFFTVRCLLHIYEMNYHICCIYYAHSYSHIELSSGDRLLNMVKGIDAARRLQGASRALWGRRGSAVGLSRPPWKRRWVV